MALDRYALVPMKDLWTPDAQYKNWLRVELAALAALEEVGGVPAGTAAAVSARARIDRDRIRAWEEETGHDLLAFLWALEEAVGPEGRWLHYGLTSSDVKDT
ncbi:MAG: adenylosuccinate lyase, partial [Candidatus Bipolaricaulis anaerobius]|nr:adenylosuccinate lyase [Candidatus Bipolaricaulis anaerobius]